MKRGNKKIKKTVKAAKVKTVKKTAVKPKPKAKAKSKARKESVLGASFKKAEILGTRIPVTQIPAREIKAEPQVDFGDFVFDDEMGEKVAETLMTESRNEIIQENILPQVQADIAEEEASEDQPDYNVKNDFSQKQKKIIMYASMVSIMAVLIVFWGLSIKNSFSQGVQAPLIDDDSTQLINQFADTFTQFSQELSGNINQPANYNINDQVLGEVKQELLKENVKVDIANQLKEKLENLNTNSLNANSADLNN